ncbi:hypothetical protein BDC45DRAFT_527745 [Circinella umbellata]|nr:hypothetical protein BDC45DRAFT_527745 [Circinella umbellata]
MNCSYGGKRRGRTNYLGLSHNNMNCSYGGKRRGRTNYLGLSHSNNGRRQQEGSRGRMNCVGPSKSTRVTTSPLKIIANDREEKKNCSILIIINRKSCF